MTTKEKFFSSAGKFLVVNATDNGNQYSNLTLNQNPFLIPVQSYSKSNIDKNYGKTNCCSPKETLN